MVTTRAVVIVFATILCSAEAFYHLLDAKQNNEFYKKNYKCPEGWTQRCEKCYLFVTEKKTWPDAKYHCHQQGGHLASIKEDAENAFIHRFSKFSMPDTQTIWIGLNDRAMDKSFEWGDKSPAVIEEFRWLPGQPNTGVTSQQENCVQMYTQSKQYLWENVQCSLKLPYVCQTAGCVIGTKRCDNGKCVSKNLFCDGAYNCEDKSDEKNCTASCGGYYRAQSGTIMSPDYPSKYGDNRDCSWLIEVDPTYKVEINFTHFDIETAFDRVEIFDGGSTASKSFGSFNGRIKPTVLVSTGTKLLVRLRSDSSTSITGFLANFKAVKEKCDQELTVTTVTPVYISSVDYPSNYPSNHHCQWKIHGSTGVKMLTIQILDMETDKDDIIEVRDGRDASAALLKQFSGSLLDEKQVYAVTTSTEMFVTFETNALINKKGFRAIIRAGCHVELNTPQGIISSLNFGSRNYPDNANCSWTISDQKLPMSLKFHEFATENDRDVVKVKRCDGGVIEEQSGTKVPELIKNVGTCFVVTFNTDKSYALKGFNATYSIGCSPLSAQVGEILINNANNYGAEVVYKCTQYFALANKNLRMCEYGGKWSRPAPYCKEINCGHPDRLENGGMTIYHAQNRTFAFQTNVTYTCNAGYRLVGQQQRTCQIDAKWTGDAPTCEVMRCSDPGTPEHGQRTGSELTVGSVVKFTCTTGYLRKGGKLLTCGLDGTWSSPVPVCQEVKCRFPTFPTNSIVQISNANLTYNTGLTFHCKAGFQRNGPLTSKCGPYGMWSPDFPRCEDINECLAKPCKGPGSQCTNLLNGYQCTCANGYRKVDNNTCEDIDECSIKPGKCNQRCTNSPGSFSCACEEGYFLYNGDNSTLNRVEARYAVADQTCLGVACPPAPVPHHGYVINYGNRYPTTIDIECDKGWVVNGSLSVKCLKNGKWSGSFSQCIRALCERLDKVDNADLIIDGGVGGDKYNLATRFRYTCQKGYEAKEGNLVRECAQTKSSTFWTGSPPVCQRVSCPQPSTPRNGAVQVSGLRYGDTARFSCHGGYDIIGNTSLTCGADRKWNGAGPVCSASPCADPGVPEHGMRIGNVSLGATVIYQCLIGGFTLTGDAQRTCYYDNVTNANAWSGTSPQCKDTTKPVFANCSKAPLVFTLPRGSRDMFVSWSIPMATDNSGAPISLTLSPQMRPQLVLTPGVHPITYTARDQAGNEEKCKVTIDVKDEEKPRIKCPSNLVIESDLRTKVTWAKGFADDNIDLKSVTFNPPSGSVFDSNTYNRVIMTAIDTHGNEDTCVMEVHVKGCGCTDRTCDYKQRGGISTCVISKGTAPIGPLISCNLECPGNRTSNDHSFHGEKIMCLPKTGWEKKFPPNCVAQKPLKSCIDVKLSLKYKSNKLGGEAQLKAVFDKLAEFGASLECGYKYVDGSMQTDKQTLSGSFKIVPADAVRVPLLKDTLKICNDSLRNNLITAKLLLLPLAAVGSSVAQDITVAIEPCCPGDQGHCCDVGHLVRTTGQTFGSSYCIPCGLGMYHNATVNKCFNCPQSYFNPNMTAERCEKCPSETSTLKEQSAQCTKLCPEGSYSSTGLNVEGTCRKCNYDEYQPASGQKSCVKCPSGNQTAVRGAVSLTQCQAPCPPGHHSTTGLQPCDKCRRGTYQEQAGSSVCTRCPSGGVYVGDEGATSKKGCPTKNACDLNLCKNGAVCTAGNYSYACTCQPGWTGVNCDKDVDECQTKPCGRYGNCTNLQNNYTCTCVPGMEGRHCDVNINDCRNDSCLNGGVCQDLVNDFMCLCPDGFTGVRCETNKNECEPLPCLHNSTCTDLINDFKCFCEPGYKGKRCQVDINECDSKPCFNNGTCVDHVNGFTCNCTAGFTGEICAVEVDECKSKPCQNNATCVDEIDEYQCQCLPGFKGGNCSINVDECNPSPCQNHGSCVDLVNAFRCDCPAGFYGSKCEKEVDECKLLKPCKNNASCVDKINDYECLCNVGFEGKRCETNTNECEEKPCQNDATCVDHVGFYSCVCHPGYTGANCSIVIDNCASSPCLNAGACSNRVNNYTCACPAGFAGRDCERDINECQPDPCNGRAVNCTDLVNDYACYCKTGYKGKDCSVRVDHCSPDPCVNGTCANDYPRNTFNCKCDTGFTGAQCSIDINECRDMPCQNGGMCHDLIGDYSCTCASGFSGVNCEKNIDDCRNDSCLNGGVCQDLVNDYVCQCPATHKGVHCEKKISDRIDITLPGGPDSYIKQCFDKPMKEFTLSLWFRYLEYSTGTLLSLGSDCTKNHRFIVMNHKGVQLRLPGIYKPFNFPNKLSSDSYWHHVLISLSSEEKIIRVYLDSLQIASEKQGILARKTFFAPRGGVILVGKSWARHALKEDGFVGEISQLAMWDRLLNGAEMAKLMKNCTGNTEGSVVPWVGLMEGAGNNVSMVEKWTCGTNKCPPDYTGKFCKTKVDKEAPRVISCPPSMKVYTEQPSVRVEWDEPVFTDNIAVVSIVRSHRSRSLFAWGDYIITYIAKDAFENAVTCTFELYVSGFNCTSFRSTNHSTYACGAWKWGEYCDYACTPNHTLATPKMPFYACGRQGTWSHGPPTYPENPDLLVSECTANRAPRHVTNNKFSYAVNSCDNKAFENHFVGEFKTLINKLHGVWKICGEKCDFTNIKVRCVGESRARRDVTTPSHTLQVSFDALATADNTDDITKVQADFKDNPDNFTLQVNGKDFLITQLNSESSLGCEESAVLKDGVCANCPAGTFKNSSMTACELCALGTYSPVDGSLVCLPCNAAGTTTSVGSTSSDMCLLPCQTGYGYDQESRKCQPCPIGFYKDTEAFEKCQPCPIGTTNKRPGAITKKLCTNKCGLNEELVGTTCQPCARGFYRNNISQSDCVACDYGFTTYSQSSVNATCAASCAVGLELTGDKQACMECQIGFYKNDPTEPYCTKCPDGLQTKMLGSVGVDKCKNASNDVMLYDVTLSFTSLTWSDTLKDVDSREYRHTAYTVIKSIYDMYDLDGNLTSVKINSFKKGSVVVDLTLAFLHSTDHALQRFAEKIAEGRFAGLTVDPDTLITNRCKYFSCPIGQECFYAVTNSNAGCKCPSGKYMSPDGAYCHVTCNKDYCLNKGACSQDPNGRTCRCPSGFSGARCEVEESSNTLTIVMIVLAVIIVLIILTLVFKKSRDRARAQYYKDPLNDNDSHVTLSLSNKKPVQLVRNSPIREQNAAFVNKGADNDDYVTLNETRGDTPPHYTLI